MTRHGPHPQARPRRPSRPSTPAAGAIRNAAHEVTVHEDRPAAIELASGTYGLVSSNTVATHVTPHGAASLAHEAGADLKTLQALLGHSSIVITADTYTNVLPLAQRKCADATARPVLAADRRTREKIRGNGRRNRCKQRPAKGGPTPAWPGYVRTPQVKTPTIGTPSQGHDTGSAPT